MTSLAPLPTPSLPTRRDEAWRYSDHAAVARHWPAIAAPETITVHAGETHRRIIDTLPASGIVRPDFVHVLAGGRIVRSGGPELALELEEHGYEAVA